MRCRGHCSRRLRAEMRSYERRLQGSALTSFKAHRRVLVLVLQFRCESVNEGNHSRREKMGARGTHGGG
jgi:hypothetical protein